jgi:predicted aconitase with swiveling domain
LLTGRVLVAGEGQGPFMRLDQAISFWGGVDPVSGTISDPRHTNHGESISGTVLAISSTVGSSSSSAIMLELLREGTAPAAILLGEADAILSLGVIVAQELGYAGIPILEVPVAQMMGFQQGVPVSVGPEGTVTQAGS